VSERKNTPAAAQVVDDLDDYLAEQLQDPAFAASYEDAGYRENLLRELIARRRDCAMSQTAVATRMGISQSTLSEFEGGVGDPRISTLQRYARAVGGHLRVGFCEDRAQATTLYLVNNMSVAPTAARLAAPRYVVDKMEISTGAFVAGAREGAHSC
jgi:transcriptional regulator with XRE-family HTH domain